MRNDLEGFVPQVQTDRPKGGRRLSSELIEALITCRVCELRVLAARTARDYAQTQTDSSVAALANALERAWRDFDSRDRD